MANTTTERRSGKTAKGLLAAGLGAALLLGTGGTFALWQDSAGITGDTFETGHLTVTADGFTWSHDPHGTNPIDDGFIISPGETVYGTATITADLRGTNLLAELIVDDMPITVSNLDGSVSDGLSDLTITAYLVRGDQVEYIWRNGVMYPPQQFSFEEGPSQTVKVYVEIGLDKQADPGQYGMDLAVKIPDLGVRLTQTAP